MKSFLGVIGGSGFEKFEGFETLELLPRNTPFGLTSSGFKKVRVEDQEFLFLSRHGEHHEVLPSEVNYAANIYAMKEQGVHGIISFSAVGSLVKECAPGDLVVPDQYIDRTKSLRRHTFLGEGIVGHISLAKPTCDVMEKEAREVAKLHTSLNTHFNKTYLCVEGPYFSTKAESLWYKSSGAHIIGMTHFPEYGLAREAGLPYLPLCFITDYDCWDDSRPHVTVDEVTQVMRKNNSKAFAFLKDLLKKGLFYKESSAYEGGLRSGLFMDPQYIPKDKQNLIDILTRINF